MAGGAHRLPCFHLLAQLKQLLWWGLVPGVEGGGAL